MQGRSTQLHAERDRHTGPDRRVHAEGYKMAAFSSPKCQPKQRKITQVSISDLNPATQVPFRSVAL
jgi:hypothetical protein